MKSYVFWAMLLVVCLSLFRAAESSAAEADEARHWRELLTSKKKGERRRAKDLTLRDREDKIEFLLSIVKRPVEEGERFYGRTTSRNIAIDLLGEMRAEEAVTELARWLTPREGQSHVRFVGGSNQSRINPAGDALVKIGLPSVPALLDVIRQEGCSSPDEPKKTREGGHVRYEYPPGYKSSPRGDRCLGIIVTIKGVEETELFLKRMMEKEKDKTHRKSLQSALDLLEAPKFRRVWH